MGVVVCMNVCLNYGLHGLGWFIQYVNPHASLACMLAGLYMYQVYQPLFTIVAFFVQFGDRKVTNGGPDFWTYQIPGKSTNCRCYMVPANQILPRSTYQGAPRTINPEVSLWGQAIYRAVLARTSCLSS